MAEEYRYKRVLLKLSGEALAGDLGYGIDPKVVDSLADEIADVVHDGVQLAIVVGGGNIFRGVSGATDGMDRAQADYIGMLATVMNALALQDAFERAGITTRVMTAIEMRAMAEPYIRARAVRHLEKGRVVIFGCGLGSPYFSTDTAAVLRAAEINADVVLLAKNIDGVYTADPRVDKTATKIDAITYQEILSRGLAAMDSTATSFCMDNHIPILVFGLDNPENIYRAVTGEEIGTIVK